MSSWEYHEALSNHLCLRNGGYTEACCHYLNTRRGVRGLQMGQSFVNMPMMRQEDDVWGKGHYLYYNMEANVNDRCISWVATRE